MTIHPKDLRTLLIRLALVTIALRAAPMFTADLSPAEAAAALGLGQDGPSAEPWLAASRAWNTLTGGQAGLLRLAELVGELALPLLAVGYARLSGWGTLAGIVGGLVLALSPWAMQAGHRFGGGALVGAGFLLALALLRGGLRDGEGRRIWASAGLLAALGVVASPILVALPAGLYLCWRSVTDDRLRLQGAAGWALAGAAALAIRWSLLGYLVPEADQAARDWASAASAEPSGWHAIGAVAAAGQLLGAASPLGAWGALAKLLDLLAPPMWVTLAGGVLAVLAVWGTVRGLVQPDPVMTEAPALSPIAPRHPDDGGEPAATGVADRDGWRTLGLGVVSVPRALGDRDWAPLLLAAVGAAIYVAQAAARGVPDGVLDALAIARVGIAVPLGAGLAALGTSAAASQLGEVRAKRRAYWILGGVALGIFGVGAWHLLAQTERVDRIAAHKVARFARDAGAEAQSPGASPAAMLAVGPRGLAVAAQLDPLGTWPHLRRAATDVADSTAHLVTLLQARPSAVILLGDRAALGADEAAPADQLALMRTLDKTLRLSGLQELDGSHRVMGATAVLVYDRGDRGGDPRQIVPQLGPGLAPGQHP